MPANNDSESNSDNLKLIHNQSTPTPTTEIVTKDLSIKSLRSQEWKKYRLEYFVFRHSLENSSILSTQSSDKFNLIRLSDLAKKLKIQKLEDQILVPENTHIAEIACIDEATQSGEFINEVDLNNNPLGSISDPQVSRYILDIAGSGAVTYICRENSENKLDLDELLELEDQKLNDLASRFAHWAQNKSIKKLTVTYHCGCGAVSLRKNNLSQILESQSNIEIAKNCATRLAKKIENFSKQINHSLHLTVAYIGNDQICKLRPMQMHNALGTIVCLDSRVIGKAVDKISGFNFFDVLAYSDFQEGAIDSKYKLNIVDSASRNLQLSMQIAMGDHGWGQEIFSYHNPYLILLFTKDDNQVEEAKLIINKLEELVGFKTFEKINCYIIQNQI
jgi:hypothetical protein